MKRNPFDVTSDLGTYLLVMSLIMIYMTGFVAYLVLVLNIRPLHTVLLPPTRPGMLTSELYSSMRYWFGMWALPIKGMLIIFFPLMIAWARINTGVSGVFLAFVVLVVLVDTLAVMNVVSDATQCNLSSSRDNQCSDHLGCCVWGDKGINATHCPSGVKCEAPVDMRPEITGAVTHDDLKWDNDFKWLFWSSLTFSAVHWIFLYIIFDRIMYKHAGRSDANPMETSFNTLGSYDPPVVRATPRVVDTEPTAGLISDICDGTSETTRRRRPVAPYLKDDPTKVESPYRPPRPHEQGKSTTTATAYTAAFAQKIN